MDAPLSAPDALIRPWRTATLVASLVAAIELVLLLGAGFLLFAKPLAHAMQKHAAATAFAPAKKHTSAPRVIHKQAPIGLPQEQLADAQPTHPPRTPAWMNSAKSMGEAQANTLKTVGSLVDENPKQAALIVRDWLSSAA